MPSPLPGAGFEIALSLCHTILQRDSNHHLLRFTAVIRDICSRLTSQHSIEEDSWFFSDKFALARCSRVATASDVRVCPIMSGPCCTPKITLPGRAFRNKPPSSSVLLMILGGQVPPQVHDLLSNAFVIQCTEVQQSPHLKGPIHGECSHKA